MQKCVLAMKKCVLALEKCVLALEKCVLAMYKCVTLFEHFYSTFCMQKWRAPAGNRAEAAPQDFRSTLPK